MDLSKFPYDFPAAMPPPGQKSNFVNPPTLGTNLIILTVVFLVLMLSVVSARLYVRGVMLKSLGADDYTIALSAISTIAFSGMLIFTSSRTFGRHAWDVRVVSYTSHFLAVSISIGMIHSFATFLAKVSLALLYRRIFGNGSPVFRYVIYGFIAVCACGYGAYICTLITAEFQCNSVFKYFQHYLCRQGILTWNIAMGVFNMVTDIFLLIMPIGKTLKLQLDIKKKIGLVLIFSCGGIACVISIVRVALIAKYWGNSDTQYTAALLSQPIIIELNIGIIAASMSVLPKLVQTKLFQSISNSRFWSGITMRSTWRSSSEKTIPQLNSSEESLKSLPPKNKSNKNIKVETTTEVYRIPSETVHQTRPWV